MGSAAILAFAAHAASLQQALDQAVADTVLEFAPTQLKPEQLAVTVRVIRNGQEEKAGFRGNVPIYPASVIKLFYLVAAHRWMEDQKLKDTPELRRAMHDMIVDSSNDATHYVLDALTETVSGPELPSAEMALWAENRNSVNRFFAHQGFQGVNANQKPWGDGPYGRDRQFVGETFTNRNMLTTESTARLLSEIVSGKSITEKRSGEMMDLLLRDPFSKPQDPDDQAHGFTGIALKPGAKLWSKAGWTSTTRHDAACVEFPGGTQVILVIFTVGHAKERSLLPALASRLLNGLENAP